jgi:UDP-N-acetylglucosamine--N-acetylmuramyl-(pentapeptide) pyrophosphoryl-undecaprenol N-acetylglucosamine transferase
LNLLVADALPSLRERRLQVIHLTGRKDEATVREAYARAAIPAYVAAFSQRMGDAYSAADLCIARSGAATLTELSHFALPAILIPYPYAAEDHQTLNARIFERAGAAAVLPERETTGDILVQKILAILDDPARLAEMSSRSAALAPRNAAERVADVILEHCQP